MKRGHKLFLIVILQVVFLLGMVGFKYHTLHFGTPVLLKTLPVDPWDMFRGEYVRLGYEISGIKRGGIEDNLNAPDQVNGMKQETYQNKTLYVVLEKRGNYWGAVSIWDKKPRLKDGQVFIKARLQYYDNRRDEYRLTYGIESYYVPEGEGKKLERQRNLEALVRVDRFGNAVIETVNIIESR